MPPESDPRHRARCVRRRNRNRRSHVHRRAYHNVRWHSLPAGQRGSRRKAPEVTGAACQRSSCAHPPRCPRRRCPHSAPSGLTGARRRRGHQAARGAGTYACRCCGHRGRPKWHPRRSHSRWAHAAATDGARRLHGWARGHSQWCTGGPCRTAKRRRPRRHCSTGGEGARGRRRGRCGLPLITGGLGERLSEKGTECSGAAVAGGHIAATPVRPLWRPSARGARGSCGSGCPMEHSHHGCCEPEIRATVDHAVTKCASLVGTGLRPTWLLHVRVWEKTAHGAAVRGRHTARRCAVALGNVRFLGAQLGLLGGLTGGRVGCSPQVQEL
mmetsp:Transcript_61733/g.135666  ORF Transcript_61733/g.135666 Transcript_61733/m.135666 type:complete len:327 (-) Transcript_61733:2306-3286(-)